MKELFDSIISFIKVFIVIIIIKAKNIEFEKFKILKQVLFKPIMNYFPIFSLKSLNP